MRYILDMVHHNPGEAPFESKFLDPVNLVDYGFNGQVFKHINCVATFIKTGVDAFPQGSPEREWLDEFTPGIEKEIKDAKASGLKVFYHLDLFVLPKRIVEHYRDEVCDPETGRIQLGLPRTLELHRVLFDELTARFPDVDGYIIRVGETYLMDTPFHAGNGPIPRIGASWTPTYLYQETLNRQQAETPTWTDAQVAAYVNLIGFLREEICVKHGRTLMFRTWDIFPDKLHACLDHYLQVSEQIEIHPQLVFSIKHTALDFWRRVKVNPCLGRGRHPQIIEVQCQREYEGKGAYANYVMDGVINGFEENREMCGLKDLLEEPLIVGVYSWSRGGGWYGPHVKSEFWPDLNAYVLASFVRDPSRTEESIFCEYAESRMGLSGGDVAQFRELCLLSARAVLKGRCCEVFDILLDEAVLPTACWMRDDRLGGRDQLAIVLDTLAAHGEFNTALAEKLDAVALWKAAAALAAEIDWAHCADGEFVKTTVEYGRLLFSIVHQGWEIMIAGYLEDQDNGGNGFDLTEMIARYDALWVEYRRLGEHPLCSTLYLGEYFSLPGEPVVMGLDATVNNYRRLVSK